MHIKKYLFFEEHTLITKLSHEEVKNRLFENIQSKKGFNLFAITETQNKPYEGLISDDSFKISRTIKYRNSYIPTIAGQIKKSSDKTLISLTFILDKFAKIFILIWACFLGLFCVGSLFVGIVYFEEVVRGELSPLLLFPFALLFIGLTITNFVFKREAKKSKQFLVNLLEAEQE